MSCGCKTCKTRPVPVCNTFVPVVSNTAMSELACDIAPAAAKQWLCVANVNKSGVTQDAIAPRNAAMLLKQYGTMLKYSWCLTEQQRDSAYFKLQNLIKADCCC